MTAVRPGDIEAVLRRGPSPQIVLVLVYGPDTGLVAERCLSLVKTFSGSLEDPFGVVKLDGDQLASDPARLVDEAGTLGLFGGMRTIHVRAGNRNFAAAIETLLAAHIESAKVVIEAGDLNRSSPLRTLCERSAKALAIPCYPDDERTLGELIERSLTAEGLRIEPEARTWMTQNLGVDRRISLSEIDKLALYAHGHSTVTLDDVEAVVSDVGISVLNALIDSAFAGRRSEIERDYRRFRHEGLDAGTVLGAASRHALTLLSLRLGDPEASASQLVANWRGLHFKRKSLVEKQLGRWRPDGLRQVIESLHRTVLECRRSAPDLAHARASAALLSIADAS